MTADDVVWHSPLVGRRERWRQLGHSGATVWITGRPGAGKSTLAYATEARLVADGRPTFVLDGDNVRHGLSADLGFGREDRSENARRVAHAAALMAEAGLTVLVALVSPYAVDRARARAIHRDQGLRFIEVFLDTPLEECERRDPKGIYRRGAEGVEFYETPADPTLHLHGDGPLGHNVSAVVESLQPEEMSSEPPRSATPRTDGRPET